LEAKTAMMKAVREHLESFLAEHPNSSYAQWIEGLQPENVHDGQLLQGLDKMIDHRFYVEASDHRQLLNGELSVVAVDSSAGSWRKCSFQRRHV
jgi:hypothetical protein